MCLATISVVVSMLLGLNLFSSCLGLLSPELTAAILQFLNFEPFLDSFPSSLLM